MSVVLGYKVDGKVWLATDSQMTKGSDKKLITDPNNFKIWRPAGHSNLILGGVGTLRDLNIMSTVDIWFDEIEVQGSEATPFDLTFQYVVRHMVPAVFAELGSKEDNRSSFMVAYQDKCFRIDFDGAVTEIHEGEFEAIGSGDTITEAAFGAVYDIDTLSTREKIIRAVGQSCEQDLGVSYPILMMNTEDLELEVFDGQTLYIGNDLAVSFEDITDYEFSLLTQDIEELMEEVQAIEDVLDSDEDEYRVELTD